jgi:hypothetical protein
MQYALISDIHANLPALKAVLAHIDATAFASSTPVVSGGRRMAIGAPATSYSLSTAQERGLSS